MYPVQDSFLLSGRGLVVVVEGLNDHPHGTRFMVDILDAQHELIDQQPAYQEWGVRVVEGVRTEFIAFCFESADKS